MTPSDIETRISRIITHWSDVIEAHKGEAPARRRAQEALLRRYSPAIYRYILGAVRDPEVAQDLAQDFGIRLLEGRFEQANPDKGRFRDLVKTSLYNMIVDWQRKKKMAGLPEGHDEGTVDPPPGPPTEVLRMEILNRAWKALEEDDAQSKQNHHAVLRYKADNPDARSREIAEALAAKLGKKLTEPAMRKALQRARERYNALLLEEVAFYCESREVDDIREALIDLELLSFCKEALEEFASA